MKIGQLPDEGEIGVRKLVPEQRLYLAILCRAISDYLWNLGHKVCDFKTSERACEAGEWLFGNSYGYFYCCEAVGINPHVLRKRIDNYIVQWQKMAQSQGELGS